MRFIVVVVVVVVVDLDGAVAVVGGRLAELNPPRLGLLGVVGIALGLEGVLGVMLGRLAELNPPRLLLPELILLPPLNPPRLEVAASVTAEIAMNVLNTATASNRLFI